MVVTCNREWTEEEDGDEGEKEDGGEERNTQEAAFFVEPREEQKATMIRADMGTVTDCFKPVDGALN